MPFSQTAAQPSIDSVDSDFYVEQFTDGKLRKRRVECMAEPMCLDFVGTRSFYILHDSSN